MLLLLPFTYYKIWSRSKENMTKTSLHWYANKRQACGGSRGPIEKQLNLLKIIIVPKESVQKLAFFVCGWGEYSFCNLPFPRSLHLWKSLPLWEKKAKKKVRLGITWNVLISLDFSVLKKRGNKLRKVSY